MISFFQRPLTRSSVFSLGAAIVALAVVFQAEVRPAQAETWTDLQSRTIEAKLVGVWDGFVILDMDGRRVKFPFNELRSDSRIKAQERWEEMKNGRVSRVNELQGRAAAASAPAPNPLPKPPATAPYQPPLSGGNVSSFLQNLDQQLDAGHLLVIYDSLPPSYRNDINEYVQLAASKINPAAWQSAAMSFYQVGEILVMRQNWFFSNPRLDSVSEVETLREKLVLVGGMLREGCQPTEITLQKLQTMEFGQWLAKRDAAVAPYVAEFVSMGTPRTFRVVSETADKARVKISQAGQEKDENFVNIEGYWVHESLANSWKTEMDSLKQEANAAAPGTYMTAELAQLTALQALLFPLGSAGDEGQFHQAMNTTMDTVRPMVEPLFASLGSSALASNNRRGGGPGGGAPGYGDGYGDMMDEEMYEDEEMYGDEEMMDEEMMDEEMYGDYEQQMRAQGGR